MFALPVGKLSRRRLIVVSFAGFVLALGLIYQFILNRPIPSSWSPPKVNTPVLHKQEEVNYGLPVRLKIPKINVDTALERVGLTPQGAVAVPKGPTNAAWFDRWPRPGERGNSVIVGHFGWRNNIPAVFDNLYKLQKGDKLSVEDEKGVVISFIVRESRSYDPKAVATDVFRSNDDSAHLNLLTCEGVWNKASKSYSKRLAVFTDKEKGNEFTNL